MNTKFVVYFALVSLSAIAAYGFFSGDPVDEQAQVSKRSQADSMSVQQCLSRPATCLQPSGSSDGNTARSACLHANAIVSQDVDYCNAISASQLRRQCVSEIGYSDAEQTLMEEWGAGPTYSLDVRDQCYSDMAYFSRDTKYCSEIVDQGEKSVCEKFTELRVTWPTEAIEKTINSSAGGITKKYQTLVGLLDKENKANALKQCMVIPDDLCVDAHDVGQLRDRCIAAVATEFEDLSLCNTISRNKASCSDKRLTHSRANCIADNIHLSGGNQALCNQIIHPLIRANCNERLETFEAN